VRESHDARLANLLGALSLAVTDRMQDDIQAAAKQTAAAPAALVALHDPLRGGSMDDLRRAVGLTPSGAVRLVDRLVAAGLVERRPGHDGRSLALVLTAGGRRAAQRVLAARAEALSSVFATLTQDERASLTRISEKLLGAVTKDRLAERQQGHEPPGGWMCRLCDFAACGRDQGACPAAQTAAGN
jgi:MarR family transcriptional repressor of emrRAB